MKFNEILKQEDEVLLIMFADDSTIIKKGEA